MRFGMILAKGNNYSTCAVVVSLSYIYIGQKRPPRESRSRGPIEMPFGTFDYVVDIMLFKAPQTLLCDCLAAIGTYSANSSKTVGDRKVFGANMPSI